MPTPNERYYSLSFYFDNDNPTGARVLCGYVYGNAERGYYGTYAFQIVGTPGTNTNRKCTEYDEWKGGLRTRAEDAFDDLTRAVNRFEASLPHKKQVETQIGEINARQAELSAEWTRLDNEKRLLEKSL